MISDITNKPVLGRPMRLDGAEGMGSG